MLWSPWQHTWMAIMATYMNGHHGNIHVCVHFQHSVTMATYMWHYLCALWQCSKIIHVQVGHWRTFASDNIAMVTHVSLFMVQNSVSVCYYIVYTCRSLSPWQHTHQYCMVLVIRTSVSACRWPSWTQEPLNLQGGKTIDHMTSDVELHSLTDRCFHTFYKATSMQVCKQK